MLRVVIDGHFYEIRYYYYRYYLSFSTECQDRPFIISVELRRIANNNFVV